MNIVSCLHVIESQAPFFIHQKHMWNSIYSKSLGKFVLLLLFTVKILGPGKSFLFDETRKFIFIRIATDANNLKTLWIIFVVCCFYPWQLCHTGDAGG